MHMTIVLMLVATVPTACGIETSGPSCPTVTGCGVATVPTACGIETSPPISECHYLTFLAVATVPTACGIETRTSRVISPIGLNMLQQCLPLAVLKPTCEVNEQIFSIMSCNSAYRLRY